MISIRGSIGKLAAIAFLGRGVGRFGQYLVTFLIAYSLGEESLGLFAFGLVFVRVLGTVSKLGLDVAAQRFIPEARHNGDHERVTGFVVICLVTPVVVGAVVASGVYLVYTNASLPTNLEVNQLLPLFLLAIPLFAVSRVGEATTRGFKETKYSVYIKDFGQSGTAAVLVGLAVLIWESITAVVIGYLVSLLVAVVLAVFFLSRLTETGLIANPVFAYRDTFLYSIPVAMETISMELILAADIIVLSVFETAGAIGLYEAAYQTSVLLLFAIVSANAIFPAVASELYHHGHRDELDQLYESTTKWITYFSMFGTTFVFIYASDILRLFGAQFIQAQNALLVLACGQFVSALVGPAGYLLLMADHERLYAINAVLLSICNVGLNLVLIARFGVLGAAAATAVSIAVLNVVRLLEVYFLMDLWPYSRAYLWSLGPYLLSLVVLLLGTMVPVNPLLKLAGVGIVSGSVFMGLLYKTAITDDDQVLFSSLS
jgi:O-antigen/teichoic acid export membrane protein